MTGNDLVAAENTHSLSDGTTRLQQLLSNWFEVTPPDKPRAHGMEGLRAMAVILVFLVHYNHMIGRFSDQESWITFPLRYLAEVGHVGVDIFFVISGYLIYGAVMRVRFSAVHYAWRRVERIYPTFLAVFALYVAVNLALPQLSRLPQENRVLYLTQCLFLLPGIFPTQPLITAAWSLSYEAFYYIFLPLLIRPLSMFEWRPAARIALLTTILVLFLAYCALVDFRLVRLWMFYCGIVLYELLKVLRPAWSGRDNSWRAVLLFICGVIGWNLLSNELMWNLIHHPVHHHQQAPVQVLAALVLGVPTMELVRHSIVDSKLSRLLSWAPLRYLGNMSYSYYLLHSITIKVPEYLLQRTYQYGEMHPLGSWLLLPPVFFLTLVSSTVLFLLVEKPISLRTVRHG